MQELLFKYVSIANLSIPKVLSQYSADKKGKDMLEEYDKEISSILRNESAKIFNDKVFETETNLGKWVILFDEKHTVFCLLTNPKVITNVSLELLSELKKKIYSFFPEIANYNSEVTLNGSKIHLSDILRQYNDPEYSMQKMKEIKEKVSNISEEIKVTVKHLIHDDKDRGMQIQPNDMDLSKEGNLTNINSYKNYPYEQKCRKVKLITLLILFIISSLLYIILPLFA